jgi:hypothetical protein
MSERDTSQWNNLFPCLETIPAENEQELDTRQLVDILKTGAQMLKPEDFDLVTENTLPRDKDHKKRLAVFSSQITKNPHGFDLGTLGGKMFLNALCTVYDIKELKDSLERAQVYYRAGILIDEISNFVTISGLLAFQGKSCDPV